MLCDSISHKLTDKGCNTLFIPICSSLTDCKEILNVLQKDDKALMLQIGSTETTKRIKVVAEAFNETNFVVPDVQDNSPIGAPFPKEVKPGSKS
ncbi:hypothetical protein GPJ56_008039 [Histomonas meleagridis]|uniref:uncharacterized protein n=1 Tax=Histomonas meleagridis TaxID=135588 RepID=UPI00355A4F8C|nr:hypothetical protein GPJ56_008039 [Histomonas meleagridis]KAH0804911.1 hypothetical protein GO595_002304 [Histomonas meleagridis]